MMLGELFLHGKGAPTDVAEARRLFELAAAQGEAHAQAGLAEMLLSDSMSGPDEVAKAKAVDIQDLKDPQTDAERTKALSVIRDAEKEFLRELRTYTQQLLKVVDFSAHFFAKIFIQRRQGFVHQENVGLDHDGTCHGNALLLAAGQLRWHAVFNTGEPYHFQCFFDFSRHFIFRNIPIF